MPFVTFLVFISFLLFSGGCDTPFDSTDPYDDVSNVASDDGLVRLLISQGAVPEGIIFSIETNNDPGPDGNIGPTYNLGPANTYFNPPAQLVFNYEAFDLPSRVNTEELVLAKLVDNQWLPLYSVLDEEEINSPVTKLSTFGLMEIEARDMMPASDIRDWARDIYEAVEYEQDPAPIIEDIFSYLVPVLDAEDAAQEDLALELIYAGIPFFLDANAQDMARGYSRGLMVEANSFFDSLDQAGFDEYSEIPLVQSYGVWAHILGNIISDPYNPFIPREEFFPHEVLPALLYKLSEERTGSTTDAWGDGFLDPLQFTLLTDAFNYAAAVWAAWTGGYIYIALALGVMILQAG